LCINEVQNFVVGSTITPNQPTEHTYLFLLK
jgi:hypothetical protein